MSAIRSDLPATTTPQAAPAAVRSAQAAFFRAALAQTQAPEAARPQSTAVQPAVTQTTSSTADPERLARPGSLLDIRV